MVKKFPVVTIFLLSAFISGAQESFLRPEYSSFSLHEFYPSKKNITLASEFYFGSTAITGKFFDYYYLGKFIDTKLKNDVSSRLKLTNNRLGAGFNASLIYTYRIKDTNRVKSIYFAGIGTRNFAESNFSGDLFDLYFRGNKSFEGETVDFKDFHFRLYQYQKLTWGKLIINPGDSSKVSFGYSGSLLIGQRFNDINVSGSLFTAPDGEYLDVTASGNLHATDSAHKSIRSFNGYGASIDFYFHYPLSNSVALNLLFSDLGFINWNNKTSVITVDTSYHFEGVEADDLFDFSDTVFSSSSLTDSSQASGFLTRHTKQSYSVVLPVKASLELSYAFDDRISFSLTDEIMSGDFFRNSVAIGMGWKASSKTIFSARAAYGGYGNFSAGIFASFLVKKQFMLTAGSHALTGLLFPAYFTSQSAFVSLKKYFD